MLKVTISGAARSDLREIKRYVLRQRPSAARGVIDRILDACDQLAITPEIGRTREELAERLRSLVISPYIIFFRIHPNEVEIVRVIDGRRDIPKQFD